MIQNNYKIKTIQNIEIENIHIIKNKQHKIKNK